MSITRWTTGPQLLLEKQKNRNNPKSKAEQNAELCFWNCDFLLQNKRASYTIKPLLFYFSPFFTAILLLSGFCNFFSLYYIKALNHFYFQFIHINRECTLKFWNSIHVFYLPLKTLWIFLIKRFFFCQNKCCLWGCVLEKNNSIF